MEIKVCEKPCDQCLFSDNKIVSEKRKKEIIRGLESKDEWFICHKSPDNQENKHMCHGWYVRRKNIGIIKLADTMGILKKVPVPKTTNHEKR